VKKATEGHLSFGGELESNYLSHNQQFMKSLEQSLAMTFRHDVCKSLILLVGAAGFEPATSTV
jgi:hypothetical protein